MINVDQRTKIQGQLRNYLANIPVEDLIQQYGTPLLILDLAKIKSQYQSLQTSLPGVKHHYALKAFERPEIIKVIRDCDGYLDVATPGEIAMAQSVSFPMNRCLHTHPIKKISEIKHAYDAGLRRFVVDNPAELKKFQKFGSDTELMIRLSHHDAEAKVNLAYKFGADYDLAEKMVAQAVEQGNTVAGFGMHVGSQICNPAAYAEAIEHTLRLVDRVEAAHKIRIRVLDMGGGFPVEYRAAVPSIEEIGRVVMPLLKPLRKRFELLSEPGRFIAGPASFVVTSVVGAARRHGEQWYYIDDGVYGCYSNKVFEQVVPHFFSLKELRVADSLPFESVTLAGPTCDSVDVVTNQYPLPKLAVGDVLVSPSMGAYTSVSATTFNAIPQPTVYIL